MIEEQPIEAIALEALVGRVKAMREGGWRLVQIGATPLGERVEVNYSFDLNGSYQTLRVDIPSKDGRLPSVSDSYWCSFIYENELHDLFGITVEGMNVDFKGKLYNMAVKFPFLCKTPEGVPPVPPAAPAAPVVAPANAPLS
jgi:ech hydrogenase subunit D